MSLKTVYISTILRINATLNMPTGTINTIKHPCHFRLSSRKYTQAIY